MIWFLDSYGEFLLSITSPFCFSLGFICIGLGVWWSRGCLFVFLAVAHWLFCVVLRVVPGTVWSLFSCSARLAHGDPPPLNPKPPSHRINHKRLTTGRLRTVFVKSTSPRSRLRTSIHHQRHSSSQADAFLEGGLCSTQQTNPPCSAGPGIDIADTIQTHALSSFVSTTYPRTEVDS
ncbi:hypothetical protein VTJ04DRAFT_3590 [Mycothermus thermophilus]|uniref:uncharacterized protein n=1 Tax=Humicola insolens TaxID=85995 RepID=UPI00374285A8